MWFKMQRIGCRKGMENMERHETKQGWMMRLQGAALALALLLIVGLATNQVLADKSTETSRETSAKAASSEGETAHDTVSLADARRVIAAAEAKAEEIGQPMNIAVADAGGNLVSHVRMDDAWIGSIDISIKKAYTSRAFDIATKDLAEHSQSGEQFFGIHASNDGKIMVFAGGIPLERDGKVIGAIGVSGGSGEQDHAVAEAGVSAF